jgi:hypothetical protein
MPKGAREKGRCPYGTAAEVATGLRSRLGAYLGHRGPGVKVRGKHEKL